MSYDYWKLRSPYDEDPAEPDRDPPWDLDRVLAGIGTPAALSPEETRLRQAMIRGAVEERTCPTCKSLADVVSTRRERRLTGFLCSRCGCEWGLS